MQSDERITTVLHALRGPREVFDRALIGAIDELRAFLADQRAPAHERVAQEAARLGRFALGHIDFGRFATMIESATAVPPAALDRIERVLELLTAAQAQGDGLYYVRVEPGTDLRDTVRDALAVRGRIFHAGRHVEQLRSGGRLDEPNDVLPFSRWRRSERLLAPPLVVEVDGSDLVADGLAEYLDGTVRIVLVVNGPAPLAPLARLITPQTYVMQTSDPAAVSALGDYAGAGIAAVLPEGCARFRHDPTRGGRLSQRLEIDMLSDAAPHPTGRTAARRQAEDHAWLSELAELAALSREQQPDTSESDAAAAPVDQLAGWLLRGACLDSAGSEAL